MESKIIYTHGATWGDSNIIFSNNRMIVSQLVVDILLFLTNGCMECPKL